MTWTKPSGEGDGKSLLVLSSSQRPEKLARTVDSSTAAFVDTATVREKAKAAAHVAASNKKPVASDIFALPALGRGLLSSSRMIRSSRMLASKTLRV